MLPTTVEILKPTAVLLIERVGRCMMLAIALLAKCLVLEYWIGLDWD